MHLFLQSDSHIQCVPDHICHYWCEFCQTNREASRTALIMVILAEMDCQEIMYSGPPYILKYTGKSNLYLKNTL